MGWRLVFDSWNLSNGLDQAASERLDAFCRLRLEGEFLQEQLLQLFLVHPAVGVTVTDQQTRRVALQLPKAKAARNRKKSRCSSRSVSNVRFNADSWKNA